MGPGRFVFLVLSTAFFPVGIDIAKNVFRVHYRDEQTGKSVSKQLESGVKFLEFLVSRASYPD
jgi:hypothetical protein